MRLCWHISKSLPEHAPNGGKYNLTKKSNKRTSTYKIHTYFSFCLATTSTYVIETNWKLLDGLLSRTYLSIYRSKMKLYRKRVLTKKPNRAVFGNVICIDQVFEWFLTLPKPRENGKHQEVLSLEIFFLTTNSQHTVVFNTCIYCCMRVNEYVTNQKISVIPLKLSRDYCDIFFPNHRWIE